MPYSHLFLLDPLIRAREDNHIRFDYYRDSITYILASDEHLLDEFTLLRAMAVNEEFNFDEYAASIVGNSSVESALPKTDYEKLNFVKHLAVMVVAYSDRCRTEDVIIFDAVARRYGYSLEVLDDVVNTIVSRIGNSDEYRIALKDNIISSYARAKEVDRQIFINAYLQESKESKIWASCLF